MATDKKNLTNDKEKKSQIEKYYKILAETAHDFIFIIDRTDSVSYVNPHAASLFGENPDKLIGVKRKVLFDESSNTLQKKVLDQVFKTGKAAYYQNWVQLKDDKRVYLDTRLVPVCENGSVTAVMGISRDLTDRKHIEELAVEQERMFHELFDAVPHAILLFGKDGIIECNNSTTRITGIKKKDIIGLPFNDFLLQHQSTAVDRSALTNSDIENVITKSTHQIKYDFYKSSHEILNFDIHVIPFPYGKSVNFLAVMHDITLQMQAKAAIQASESRFRDIINRSIDGYFFIDPQYKFTQINRSAEEILTYSLDELNEFMMRYPDKPWNVRFHRILKRAKGGKSIKWEDFSIIDKEGRKKWLVINARRVIHNGVVTGIEGFIKDITQHKKIEIELSESEARYRAIFESTPHDVFGLTPDLNFLKVNQNFVDHWGKLEKKSLSQLSPRTMSKRILKICRTVEAEHKPQVEYVSVQIKGKKKHYQVILAPIITQSQDMIGFAGLLIDVTELVQALDAKKSFAERLIQNSEELQHRISRDIHDSLGQLLFALQMEFTNMKQYVDTDRQDVAQLIQNAENLLSQSMKETRELCGFLRPQLLDDFGLVAALEDLFRNAARIGNVKVNFNKSSVVTVHDKILNPHSSDFLRKPFQMY